MILTEIDHGPDEDRPEAEVVARLGQGAIELWDTELVPPSGWNVGTQWRIAAWRDFARVVRSADEPVLLVTSNGAARFALAAFALNGGDSGRSMKLRTGAYGVIEIDDGGAFRLVEWDRRPE